MNQLQLATATATATVCHFPLLTTILQGHSNCVGCQTALRASALPPVPETQAIQRYLKPLTALARAMATEDGPPSLDLLVEENVAQQVRNLLHSQVVQDDWKRRGKNGVTVHGWVYQLENVSRMRERAASRKQRTLAALVCACLSSMGSCSVR